MLFRDYRASDFKALTEFWTDLGMGGKERGDTPEIIRDCISLGGKLLILEDEKQGSIIGSSWMTFDGRRIALHHFGIKKEFQGKGFGTQLANESLRFIKEKGSQVKLEVHKNSLIAKKLYEKLGFFAFTDYDIYMIRETDKIEIK